MNKTVFALLIACGVLSAQAPAPLYRETVTARTVKAVSYQHRSGETKIDFSGTALMPGAHGTAKVEGKKGFIAIDAEFRDMPEATQFGAEYLTYVLWAITPDGRTSNLGEIIRDGNNGKLNVTTEFQEFALIVTAEPYFAVSRPSDVVAMENEVRRDTNGGVEPVEAKYELFQRGQYLHLANVLDLQLNRKFPIELYEARNAVQIARASGADRFAADTFQKAESELKEADGYQNRNAGSKSVTMVARQAVQTAEDARAIAVKRQDDDILAAERKAGADRALRAENGQAAAQSETDRVTRDAASAKASAQAEADRLKRGNDAQTLASQTEAARLKQDNDNKMLLARNEAAGLKADNDAQHAASQAELERLQREKVTLRALLLIVNMSDVLFDTGKFTLRPEAREKLARVAGIVEGHPGLKLAVEGYTDSVGADDYNQTLSENRGGSVRDDLIQQGMAADAVTSAGFGKTRPVASNDTADGRQQNRRVEIVISGDIIGTAIGIPLAAK